MTLTTPGLVGEVLDGWVEDVRARDDSQPELIRRPVIQQEIIPIACVWSLVRVKLGHRPNVYDFTQDIVAHEAASETWTDLAKRAGDMALHVESRDYSRYIRGLEIAGQTSPYAFELYAAQDGRPEALESISGVEVSLIGAIGHAAYNSTSGSRMLVLRPQLGPPRDDTLEFLREAGPTLTQLTEQRLL